MHTSIWYIILIIMVLITITSALHNLIIMCTVLCSCVLSSRHCGRTQYGGTCTITIWVERDQYPSNHTIKIMFDDHYRQGLIWRDTTMQLSWNAIPLCTDYTYKISTPSYHVHSQCTLVCVLPCSTSKVNDVKNLMSIVQLRKYQLSNGYNVMYLMIHSQASTPQGH